MSGPNFQNYYQILGFDGPRSFDKDKIREKYIGLAKKYHPDINHDDDAEEKFKQIGEARVVLSDDELRKKYNVLYLEWEKENTKELRELKENQEISQKFDAFKRENAIDETMRQRVGPWMDEIAREAHADIQRLSEKSRDSIDALMAEAGRSTDALFKSASEWNPFKNR